MHLGDQHYSTVHYIILITVYSSTVDIHLQKKQVSITVVQYSTVDTLGYCKTHDCLSNQA